MATRFQIGNTLEGPKLYKRNGYYTCSRRPAGRHRLPASSAPKNIYGPYEHRIGVAQGRPPSRSAPGPPGSTTPSAEDCSSIFLQDRPRSVRARRGTSSDGLERRLARDRALRRQRPGATLLVHRKPTSGRTWPVAVPQTSDEFGRPFLGCMHRNRNPHTRLALARRGVRLPAPIQRAGPPRATTAIAPPCASLYDARIFSSRNFPPPRFAATTTLSSPRPQPARPPPCGLRLPLRLIGLRSHRDRAGGFVCS